MILRFESTTIPPEPAEATRRVVIELPQSQAEDLAGAIFGIHWADTDVEDELCALYDALLGVW